MKEVIAVIFVILFCVFSWKIASAESISNQIMKECVQKYAPSWNKAAACHSDYRVGQSKYKNEKIKKLLAEKPWYRGKNWKWEDKAEYTCVKQYDTGMTICHKPIYIN